MEAISNTMSHALNYLTTMRISDFIDILIVAYIIYKLVWAVRKTNSKNLALGILLILIVLGLSSIFKLTMINTILRKAVELGFIAIIVLFQPELRRFLERIGGVFSGNKGATGSEIDESIAQTVQACGDMSASRTGALIIFERKVSLTDIIRTGTVVNADNNAEVMKNLFFNKAPLHDGAVIIRNGRIAAAGCVLPLTQKLNLSKELGMRHRAGIGLSEQSDAVVVIVSEETGAISVAIDGSLKRHLTCEALDKLLHQELVIDNDDTGKHGFLYTVINTLKKLGRVDENEGNQSL